MEQTQPPRSCCLIYSGGMDSTVLLYKLLDEKQHVHCLSFQYGQRHGKELAHASAITQELQVKHYLVHAPTMAVRANRVLRDAPTIRLFQGSSQTDTVDVPEGHYEHESMKLTVVPNRNMIMLSLAAAYCVSNHIRDLYYAAHAGDHAIYPDCRPSFWHLMNQALLAADYDYRNVELHAPFIEMTKAQICHEGWELDVPFARTWSCYQGRDLHCGKCGTCVERHEAFVLAGLADPTEYERYEGAIHQ